MAFLWLINAGYEPLNWDDPPSFPRFVPFKKKSHIFFKRILPFKPSWRCLLREILVILSDPSLQLQAMLVVCSCSEYYTFQCKRSFITKKSHKKKSKLLAPPIKGTQTHRNPPMYAKHLVSPVCPRCLLQSLDRNGCLMSPHILPRDAKRLALLNVPLKHQQVEFIDESMNYDFSSLWGVIRLFSPKRGATSFPQHDNRRGHSI